MVLWVNTSRILYLYCYNPILFWDVCVCSTAETKYSNYDCCFVSDSVQHGGGTKDLRAGRTGTVRQVQPTTWEPTTQTWSCLSLRQGVCVHACMLVCRCHCNYVLHCNFCSSPVTGVLTDGVHLCYVNLKIISPVYLWDIFVYVLPSFCRFWSSLLTFSIGLGFSHTSL